MYKIAVLDDDETWNVAAKRFFSRQGFEVKTFTSPSDFLAEAEQFNLALIDFYLSSSREAPSDLNGYAIIRNLKHSLEKCPILVLVSAFVDMESARLFPEADFFLVKDIGLDIISQRARELIESRQNPLEFQPMPLMNQI
ncbi:response regulator [Kovacikia minuta CCNUW1]|uniref:response regulator n=1 Tax=Kovacikia minuta TaxID=2931930 RepID=UPI001CCD4691|nr:response regulator [Kovacikia minuta]UBF27853.1 response regulator [Kovacikia minuta CCNUW1]